MIFALLDEGTTVTLINSSIIKKIGTRSIKSDISLKGIGVNEEIVFSKEKVNLYLRYSESYFELHNVLVVLVVDNLALPLQVLTSELTKLCKKETKEK